MPQIVATRKTWYQIRLQNDFVMKLHILMPSKRLRFNFAVHRFYVLGSLFVLIFGTTSGSKLWQNSWIIKQTVFWKFWRIYLAVPWLLEPERCTALKAASSSSPFFNSIARLFLLDPLICCAAAEALASSSLKYVK